MYIAPEKYLAELDELGEDAPGIVDYRVVSYEFPDLRLYRHPHGRILYCSFDTGPYCDRVEIDTHNNRVIAGRFIEELGVRVYDDPPIIDIASVNQEGFGVIPDTDWEEQLKTLGWDRYSISVVKDHLEKNPPINY